MGVKDRLIEFIKYVQGTDDPVISRFEKECSLKNSYVQSIRKSIGHKALPLIKARYPKLNEVWLLHGQGEMLLTHTDTTVEAGEELSKLNERVRDLQAQCNVLLITLSELSGQVKGKATALISGQLQEAIDAERVLLHKEYLKTLKQEPAS